MSNGQEPMLSGVAPSWLTPAQRQALMKAHPGHGMLVYKSGPDTIREIRVFVGQDGIARRADNQKRFDRVPVDLPPRPRDLDDLEYDHSFDDYYGGAYDFGGGGRLPESGFARTGAIRWAQKVMGGLYGPWVVVTARHTSDRSKAHLVEIAVLDHTETVLFDSLINPGVRLSAAAIERTGLSTALLKTAPTLLDVQADVTAILKDRVLVTYDSISCQLFTDHFQCNPENIADLRYQYSRFVEDFEPWGKTTYQFTSWTLAEACQRENLSMPGDRAVAHNRALYQLLQTMVDTGQGMRWPHPWTIDPDLTWGEPVDPLPFAASSQDQPDSGTG